MFATDQSMLLVLTGAVNEGKTTQLASIIKAVDLDTGEFLFTPCLFLVAEASSYGTAGPLLSNPAMCVVWPVADCDEALAALNECFPDGGPLTIAEARKREHDARCKAADKDKRPRPQAPADIPAHIGKMTLRSVAVDTISTLYKGSEKTAANISREDIAAGKAGKFAPKTTRSTSNHGAMNNSMDQGRFASGRCQLLIDRMNGITQHHRGVLVVVSCHTRPLEADVTTGSGENVTTEKRVVGSAPGLGATKTAASGCKAPTWSATWNDLSAKANVIVHCFAEYPDFGDVSLSRAIEKGAQQQTAYGVVTVRGTYDGIGRCLWVKSQGAPGTPMEHFLNLPNIWSAKYPIADPSFGIVPSADPNIGLVLSHVVKAQRHPAPHAVAC